MFNVILATTNNNGIGFNNKLPWNSPEELKQFKLLTKESILVVGRKTAETLPKLKDRVIWCLTSQKSGLDTSNYKNVISTFTCFDILFQSIESTTKPVFIAGGGSLYTQVFSKWRHKIDKVYMSIMKDEYTCDTSFTYEPHLFTVDKKVKFDDFIQYELSPKETSESSYLKLLKDVYINGWEKVGRNGTTKSMFGKSLEFDLTKGFPLLTTKRMFWRGIVEELLFFIRGDTDSNKLEEKKIKIWSGNTSRDFLDSIGKNKRRKGVMGPMYGYQWRNYNAEYDEEKATPKNNGVDQLKIVVDQIRNDPHSRRILLTDYNPIQAKDGVLYPCHSIVIQFYVCDGFLDIICYNRSSDLFHGLPFNIASTALFHTLIATITGLKARKLILHLGDSHIYESHYDVVNKQLNRVPFVFPTLCIEKELKNIEDIENLSLLDLKIENYTAYPTLKADMIA